MRRIALALCLLGGLALGVVPAAAELDDSTLHTVGDTYYPGDDANPAPLNVFTVARGERVVYRNLTVPSQAHTVSSGSTGASDDGFLPATIPPRFFRWFDTDLINGGKETVLVFCSPSGTSAVCGDRVTIPAGTYKFHCSAHESTMTGTLVVTG